MSHVKTTMFISLFAASIGACGGDDASTNDDPLGPHADLYECVEEEFQVLQELSGPGYDPSVGPLDPVQPQYLVSTTMLYWKPGEKDAFYAQGGDVMAQIAESEGLVAWAVGVDESCRVARAISIWRSEEDMYRFVVSGAHGEATSMVHDLSDTGRVARWWVNAGDVGDVDWDEAREQLEGVSEHPVY